MLTQAGRERHKAIAKATFDDERIQISLRVSKRNLSKLKARALREGMPYQTLINSILHKAVKLPERWVVEMAAEGSSGRRGGRRR